MEAQAVRQWRFEGESSAVNVTNDMLPRAIAAGIGEALGKAILEAKSRLKSDLISWALAEVSGENGGFTELCQVKVAIYAKTGPTSGG